MSDKKYIGYSEFTYKREHVDELFSWLAANRNSISLTFRCYGGEHPEIHEKVYEWLDLIEQIANTIREGAKTSQVFWDKMLERVKGCKITKCETVSG